MAVHDQGPELMRVVSWFFFALLVVTTRHLSKTSPLREFFVWYGCDSFRAVGIQRSYSLAARPNLTWRVRAGRGH